MTELLLSGLDGANPLGYLAALGTFRSFSDALPGQVRMSWKKDSGGWRPLISIGGIDEPNIDPWDFSGVLACLLDVPRRLPSDELLSKVKQLEKNYRESRGVLAKLEKTLKEEAINSGIKRADLNHYMQDRCAADRMKVGQFRQDWLSLLTRAVYSPEMGLGKTLSVLPDEYRAMAKNASIECRPENRLVADLLAAFGTETCVAKSGFVDYTPFCFVSGSGQQYFLDTIQKLMSVVSVVHLQKTLFYPWSYDDERYSLRWDPADDRRYALMWDDPTASGNEAKTMWAANLLGYRGLSIFPSIQIGSTLKATGFTYPDKSFTWPIWGVPISLDITRSLVSSVHLIRRPLDRVQLEALGVVEIFESKRIQVGTPPLVKINFSRPQVL